MKHNIRFYLSAGLCTLLLSVPAFAEYEPTIIKQVQQALNEAGYDCGEPDGMAGDLTAEAIRAYQSAAGLTEDGEITEELLKSLGIGGEDALDEASGLRYDISKFSEDLYTGSWYNLDPDETHHYELFLPADWEAVETPYEDYQVIHFTLPNNPCFGFMIAVIDSEAAGADTLDMMSQWIQSSEITSLNDIAPPSWMNYSKTAGPSDGGAEIVEYYRESVIIADDRYVVMFIASLDDETAGITNAETIDFEKIVGNVFSSLRTGAEPEMVTEAATE